MIINQEFRIRFRVFWPICIWKKLGSKLNIKIKKFRSGSRMSSRIEFGSDYFFLLGRIRILFFLTVGSGFGFFLCTDPNLCQLHSDPVKNNNCCICATCNSFMTNKQGLWPGHGSASQKKIEADTREKKNVFGSDSENFPDSYPIYILKFINFFLLILNDQFCYLLYLFYSLYKYW